MKNLSCFIPVADVHQVSATIQELKNAAEVAQIYLLATDDGDYTALGCPVLRVDALGSSQTVAHIAEHSQTEFSLIYTKYTSLALGYFALNRFLSLAQDSQAGMVYADHYQIVDGVRKPMPLIACQEGSLRDDFNFGSLLIYRSATLKAAVAQTIGDYPFAGMYNLRLAVSRLAPLVHINEYLYTEVEQDTRQSGQKLFDYVDPKNRAVQIDMEKACTEHLKAVGGYLEPVFTPIRFENIPFEFEASVIIPVYNRIKTIEDAIQSVLMQETAFPFNLIIVDNHSTDGTTEAIQKYAHDKRLVHVIPNRHDLGIGGCWNMGVHHPLCGKFAIQLDSDDVYADAHTLTKMVAAFYEQNCAMVVGTYRMTNFSMETIPPGIIDHKEWTPDNGRNNALRINGLGAPRAFYTPLLRQINLPNTSYGEDYALGLRFSRQYQIGRVYEVVYCCRRWDGNSDAALDIVKQNAHNLYKDRIRTWELQARKQLVKQGKQC
jgi:Glycosyltransferases involved in cell wall biogenesis